MKKATLLPPPLFLKGGGGGGGHGRWMVQKQELPLSLNQSWFWFARVSACMCPHVYFTRLTRPLLIHQSCLPGCHTAFQHVSQSLCHMHYLRLMLTLMQIAAEMFVRYARLSHGTLLSQTVVKKRSNLSSTCVFILRFSTSGRAETSSN